MSATIWHRWWKNGDHPEDGGDDTEGRVVRYFRHPDVSDEVQCDDCGNTMFEHGWIDQGGPDMTVCPGDYIITDPTGHHYSCKPELLVDAVNKINSVYEETSIRFPVAVSASTYVEVKKAAGSAGMSPSDWISHLIGTALNAHANESR